MKPYFKAFCNLIKFNCKKLSGAKYYLNGILLFGYDTKFTAQKGAEISLGSHIISDGRFTAITDKSASLSIGNNVYFNEGAMISCKKSVKIGNGCQFGPNVKIFDNNHIFSREEGVLPSHSSGEVEIGDNCWIASNAVILKGAKIGKNCVIGANCVIKEEIPSGSIVTLEKNLKIRDIQ